MLLYYVLYTQRACIFSKWKTRLISSKSSSCICTIYILIFLWFKNINISERALVISGVKKPTIDQTEFGRVLLLLHFVVLALAFRVLYYYIYISAWHDLFVLAEGKINNDFSSPDGWRLRVWVDYNQHLHTLVFKTQDDSRQMFSAMSVSRICCILHRAQQCRQRGSTPV